MRALQQVQHMSGDYLAPAMRPLKAEQIGLSSHKNTYSRGVLEGNWIEEKGSWDAGTAEERVCCGYIGLTMIL